MASVKISLGDGLKTTLLARDVEFFADEPLEDGGTNEGPKPTEMLMAALGACAAITSRLYAQRKGWNLEGVEVDVTWEKFAKADYPAYEGTSDWVNDFQQRITFTGDLTNEQKARLLEIAGKCPVHRILTQPNFITETLVEPDTVSADVPPESA